MKKEGKGKRMREIVLFIAMSLDGYIADRDGGVDWLAGQGEAGAEADTYPDFVKDVDTVLMGWKTYHQVATELSPEEWVYSDLKSYVITHRELPSTEQIRFTNENPCSLVRRLRQEPGKRIWICGGSHLIGQLMREDLVDLYVISVIPTILGGGIPLFSELEKERKLRLAGTWAADGIVELVYRRRETKSEGGTIQ